MFHLINRCVRRTSLCGEDVNTGKDYSHRKEWIRSMLEELAGIFALDVMSFAVLSNHTSAKKILALVKLPSSGLSATFSAGTGEKDELGHVADKSRSPLRQTGSIEITCGVTSLSPPNPANGKRDCQHDRDDDSRHPDAAQER